MLRFAFRGDETDRLREAGWEEWLATFNERRLNLLQREERKDGRQSNVFRRESPHRSDA